MRQYAMNGAVVYCESTVVGTYATDTIIEANHGAFGGVLVADTVDVAVADYDRDITDVNGIDIPQGGNIFVGNGVILQHNTAITGSCFFAMLEAPLLIMGDVTIRNNSATRATIFIDVLAKADISGLISQHNHVLHGSAFIHFESWACGLIRESESFADQVSDGVGIAFIGDSAAVDFTNVRIANASVESDGVLYASSAQLLSVRSSVLIGNVVGGSGSAIYAKETSKLYAEDVIATENIALFYGTIRVENSKAQFSRLRATGNIASDGGVLHARQRSQVTLSQSFLQDNAASLGSAGAIYAGYNAKFKCNNITFDANSAQESGGAVAIDASAVFDVSQGKFVRNAAEFGGALSLNKGSTFNSRGWCEFAANSASADGGVVYIGCNSKTVFNKSSDTFKGNRAVNAGGVAFFDHRCAKRPDLPDLTSNYAGYGNVSASGLAYIQASHENIEETSGVRLARPISVVTRDALGQLCETLNDPDSASVWLTLDNNAPNASLNGGVNRVFLQMQNGIATTASLRKGVTIEALPGTSITVTARMLETSNGRGTHSYEANVSVPLRPCRVGEYLANSGTSCSVCDGADEFNLYPLREDMVKFACSSCPKSASCSEPAGNVTGHSIKPRHGCALKGASHKCKRYACVLGFGVARTFL